MYIPDKDALDWIENRAPCSEFRLKDADFTVGNQNMIRELYRTRMLMMKANEFDRLLLNDFNVGKINESIKGLQRSTNFDYLYNARYGKLGPGEVMLYLLIDKVSLGSGKTGDVVLGNKKIEVKSGAKQKTKGRFVDFRITKIRRVDEMIERMRKLGESAGFKREQKVDPDPDRNRALETDLAKTISSLRNNPKTKREFNKIESDWQAAVHSDYIKDNHICILNKDTNKIDLYLHDLKSASKFKIYRIQPGMFAPFVIL